MLSRLRSIRQYLSAALLMLMLVNLLPLGTALAEVNFTNSAFQLKWQRADKPVNDGTARPLRSWLWGPESFLPSTGVTETYKESPNGSREVLYFDKARMEINDPAAKAVSNGLLVRELISGKLATGDSAFVQRLNASDVPVAGDPNANDGPTYASFAKIASLNNDNPASDRTGQAVSDTLDKAGVVGNSTELGSKAKYVYYDTNLKHNIPDVFWAFMNQRGTIYQDAKLVEDRPVLGDNQLAPWLDATGLPLAEAYWAKVTTAGKLQDVLIQPFERRVLTYNPANPAGFQVEMGNVGRHYFGWRYSLKYDPPVSVTPPASGPVVKSCADLPNGTASVPIRCGPAGMEIMIGTQLTPGEPFTVTPIDPNGKNLPTLTSKADAGNGGVNAYIATFPTDAQGMWTYKLKGQTNQKEVTAYVWLDAPVKEPTIILSTKAVKDDEIIWFSIIGFNPNQQLTISLHTPANFNFRYGVRTSAGGGFLDNLIMNRDIRWPEYRSDGEQRYTAAEKDGKRYVVTYFTYTAK